MTTETAPLQNFQVVGIVEKTVGINAGTSYAREVAGGTCWHCGTNIRICVQAKNMETGEVVDIGTTCAERIGLDPKALKHYLAERFAEERWLRSKAHRDAQHAEDERLEAEQAAKYGEHGSETRYQHCNVWGNDAACAECTDTAIRLAPHGTTLRFWERDCSCDECVVAALVADRSLLRRRFPVLVDLTTGSVVDEARMVGGRYGTSWLIPSRNAFVPAFRQRRETVAKRGYTYAEAEYVAQRGRHYADPDRRVRRISSPTVDDFGEPIGNWVDS